MKITVERIASDDDSTVSLILIDGRFQCFGLEDEYRELKVSGETRIPAGLYQIALRTEGRFHSRYSRRFSGSHHGMLHILNVPEFTWILIHVGNTDDHTSGCLLVGTGAMCRAGDMMVMASVEAYRALYKRVWMAARDDNLTIEFIDRDK